MGRRRAVEREAAWEVTTFRQVFETWWIEVPLGFEETWVDEGGYWHAWDAHRSVSLSSTVLTEPDGRPADAAEVAEWLASGPMLEGEPIDDAPPGMLARATIIHTDPDSRASRAITGWVAVDGRVLIATVTSDDLDWARETWRSIGYRAAPLPAAAAVPDAAATASRRRRPGWDRALH